MRRSLVAVFFLAYAIAPSPAADFAYQDYVPSTLKDAYAIGEKECGPLDPNTVALVGEKTTFRVPAVWQGDLRPIDEKISGLLFAYEKVRGLPFSTKDIFKTEVRVTDAGRAYWLPIQEQILAAFKTEVGPVKNVTLYIAYFGCQGTHVAVTINEFEAAAN